MDGGIRELPSKDNRQKVDLQFTEHVTDIYQNKEKISSKSISVFDLRKSLAWDSTFFDSPGVLDPEEFRETLNIQLVDKSEVNKKKDSESRESVRVSAANARKSLAWDNAFFTSAGVLDAEELSIVNRGFKRPDFSQFHEETWHSSDLNSGDAYSLASLEIDLFDDIRSSHHNASSSVVPSMSKLKRKNQKPHGRASKKSDGSSQVQHGAPIGGLGSSSRKPPKISSHLNLPRTLPSKRPNQVNKASKSATEKKMCLRDSCNVSRSSLSPLKSPSSVLTASRNYHPGLRYASVDLISRNPRRRIDPQMAASVSSCKISPKHSTKSKSEVANSSSSIRLFTTPKPSPYKSPSSSINISSKTLNSANHIPVRSNSRQETQTTKSMDSQINVSTSSSNPTSVSRKLTPTRLQMPSPKLGYFDAERSIGLTENEDAKCQSGSIIGSASEPVNITRCGRNRLPGTLAGSGSILANNNEGKRFLRENEKQLGSKERENVKEKQLSGCNKENIIMENSVHSLTRRMGAMSFSQDSIAPGL